VPIATLSAATLTTGRGPGRHRPVESANDALDDPSRGNHARCDHRRHPDRPTELVNVYQEAARTPRTRHLSMPGTPTVWQTSQAPEDWFDALGPRLPAGDVR